VYKLAAMPAESPSPPGSAGSPDAGGATPARSEAEIDSPSRLTLRLLGVVFALTMLPWVGAKVACNRRDAPIRPPPPIELSVLAPFPKEVGLELSQRAARGDYRGAAELAHGPAAAELLAEAARCDADPSVCATRRADAERVRSRAVLLSRERDRARVRTESFGPGGVERYLLRLERSDGGWRVVQRAAGSDDAEARSTASADGGAPRPDAGSPH
jgi:hypothetical protein